MTRNDNTPRYLAAVAKVESREEYDIQGLARSGAFWWIRDHRVVRKVVLADAGWENILQARITGDGRGKRYLIQGRNVKKFIHRYGPGIELVAHINTSTQ